MPANCLSSSCHLPDACLPVPLTVGLSAFFFRLSVCPIGFLCLFPFEFPFNLHLPNHLTEIPFRYCILIPVIILSNVEYFLNADYLCLLSTIILSSSINEEWLFTYLLKKWNFSKTNTLFAILA